MNRVRSRTVGITSAGHGGKADRLGKGRRFIPLRGVRLVFLLTLLPACAAVPFLENTPGATKKAPPPPLPTAAPAPAAAKTTPAAPGPAIPLPDEARRRLEGQNRLTALMGARLTLPQKPLIGLEMKAVVELMGPPGFIHRDPPAQIWRYGGADCRLDLFLYRRGSTMMVTHAEARGKRIERADVTACLQSIIQARGPIHSR